MKRLVSFVIALGAIALTGAPPLSAQNAARGPLDLSGEWAPLFHEDQPERIPGPTIGAYPGFPSKKPPGWTAAPWTPRTLPLPKHRCNRHPPTTSPPGPANLRFG